MTNRDQSKAGSPQPVREDSPLAKEVGRDSDRRLPKAAEDMDIKTPTEPVAPPTNPPAPGTGRGSSPTSTSGGVDPKPNARTTPAS